MHRCTERQLYDIPRVSKRQRARRRFHARVYTHAYTELRARAHTHTRARAAHVLSVCSYAKRARDLRLFCQPPPRLSLVLHSLLCFTLLVLVISLSLSFSLSFSLSLAASPAVRALLSLLRVSFPFPSISLMCKSLPLAPTVGCERAPVSFFLFYTLRAETLE